MEGLNFHAKRGSNKAAADGRTQDHEGRGGRLDEQPAKRSLGLLPSGPDPVGEGRACRQPPSPLYRRSRPSRQPLFQTVLSPCRLALGHERDRQAVELAVEGKGRLVVFVVHAGSCVRSHVEGFARLERKRDRVRERALPCLDAIDGDGPGSALAKAGAVIGKGEFDFVFPGRERGSAFDLWPGQIEEVVGEYWLSFEEMNPSRRSGRLP